MSTASMTIKTVLRIVPLLANNIAILLRGNHGIGKSQVARQIASLIRAKMLLANPALNPKTLFPVIDRRLSQQTEGDLLGLPSTDDEVTRWNPPDWYKKACAEPVFLFLDEINRATTEVQQAAFQIILDRELNGWRLHPETRVMSAVNIAARYTVNEMDPALLDRFWCVDLDATVQDWLTWGRAEPSLYDDEHAGLKTNCAPLLVDFIEQNEKWLDPGTAADPGSVETSRRSWDRLSLSLTHAGLIDHPEKPEFYSVCLGFVGTEAAIAFHKYASDQSAHVTGDDLLNKFDKVKHKIDKLGPEGRNIAIEKLVEHVLKNITSLDDKQGKNVATFMGMLDDELRLSLWSKLTSAGTEKIDLARSLHKHCVKLVLDVFGVPLGEAGVGTMPNIPGIFKKDKTNE